MKPVLFELFGEPVPPYFALLLLGFAVAIYLGARATERSGLDREVFIDLGLYSIIMGVLGGRVLHVLADGYFWDYVHLCTDPSQVAWHVQRGECPGIGGRWDAVADVCRPIERNCFAWAEFWRGGLAYYGGLIAAMAFAVYFLRKERFPLGKGIDTAGMVIPIGLFFGRIGCFLGGCCFGQPFDGPFAVSFPPGSPASTSQWRDQLLASPNMPSLHVHPTQLYESAGSLLIAAIAMWVVAPRKRFDGQVMLFFLGAYSFLRFAIEIVRADDRGGVLGLSTSQLISLVIVAACVAVWRTLAKRARTAMAPG
jgi:phosphatidylglycerol---prolipoprotein diacylglyceryl transferase